MDLDTFARENVRVVEGDPTKMTELFELLGRAFSLIAATED
jgi:hypothetical protein